MTKPRTTNVADSVTVSLVISSTTLSPSAIQERLGVQVDEQKEKGRIYGRSRTEWKENTCVIRERREGNLHAEVASDNWLMECLGALLDRVRKSASTVRTLAQEGDVGILISVQSCRQPPFVITSDSVRDIAELGAWLEYDVILFSEEDEA